MKARLFWISLATAAILGLTSIAAFAQDRKVNCDVGQSLQDAINKAAQKKTQKKTQKKQR